MGWAYEIDAARKLVTSRGWGIVTATEVFEHQRALGSDPAFRSDFLQVIDLSAVSEAQMDGHDVRAMAHAPLFSSGAKRAVIAPDPVVFGLSRMFETFRDISGGTEQIRVFKDRNEAMLWLLGD